MLFIFRYLYCKIFFFFFNDTATTETYTLSLHDALPICQRQLLRPSAELPRWRDHRGGGRWPESRHREPQLLGELATLRRGQLLRERRHPVLPGRPDPDRSQYPADRPHLGSAAEWPAPGQRVEQ